jgi:hypothetical protein
MLLSVFVLLLFSCKKYIQQQEENEALTIITNGVWIVTEYQQNSNDITASFSGYVFKFNANDIVTGTKDSVSLNGVWSADITSQSIVADFPTAGDPLKNLNETWKITDSSPTTVAATSNDTTNHTSNILHLQKQ